MLEVRMTPNMGRGVFAVQAIPRGTKLVACQGWLASSNALDEEWHAMQIGPDLWLCSAGDSLDDCINHGCEPNAGFTTGEPILYALRDIAAGEQLAWDYSTSIAEPGWTLECLCGAPSCRKVIRSWWELGEADRARLRPSALAYLRDDGATSRKR
jgi:hypothetical protein